MSKRLFAIFILSFCIKQANAQIGVMKLVGNGTENYKLGFGAFLKTGFPVSEGSDATLEIGLAVFPSSDAFEGVEGTMMCPLKVGYRYTLNGTGRGFYVEPQVGYNLYGITSFHDEIGKQVDLTYHGAVFAAGTGYLFNLWRTPFDLNLRYETVIAHGGSNNFISLGISKFISFKKRETEY